MMIKKRIENIGEKFIVTLVNLNEMIFFTFRCIRNMLDPSKYNSAVIDILFKQIYYTSVQILPTFIAASIIFGSLFTGLILTTVKTVGLQEYLGDIISKVLFTELSPLIVTLLLALRTSSAINAETAVMKVNRELDTLRIFKIDIISYLFVPRILSVMISAVLLNGLFSIIVALSGGVFSFFIFDMDFGPYMKMIAKSTRFIDIVIIFVKMSFFGFFITLIPLYSGAAARYRNTEIPVAVLNGMVRVFIAITVIEVISLTARFI